MARGLSVTFLAIVCGCRFSGGALVPDANSDVLDPDAAADSSPDALMLGPWGPATPVGVGGATADDPSLTGDLLELYFNENQDIYVAKRTAVTAPWGAPALVPLVSSSAVETTPEVSFDGLTLFVGSDRSGAMGMADVWVSTRPNRTAAWGAPVNVTTVNTPTFDASAAMSDDGLLLVLSSSAVDPQSDLVLSQRATTAQPWPTPVPLALLNTNVHEGSGFITADKLAIYFDTARNGGVGLDLYVSQRTSVTDAWPAPVPTLMTADDEQDPWVSPDNRHLFFSGNRGGVTGLYEATR